MKEITEKEALSKMESYCSLAEHCTSEVREKLRKWELPDEIISNILQQLEKDNFINEERFCKSYIHDKFRINKWGKVKIAQGLRYKGVPSAMAWEHLNEIDHDEYLETLQMIMNTKRRSIRAKNEYEFNGKLIKFALGRGFAMEDITKCLKLPED